METVVVAIIVALSTLGATFIGNRLSSKRFEMELARQREVDERQRKWIVRSEPLLKLRSELAIMATKESKLVAVAYKQHTTRFLFSEEELKDTLDDSNSYLASGDFANALLTLDDTEIVNKAREILTDYQKSYTNAMRYSELKTKERRQALDLVEINRNKVIEVQSLINKRLEEL
ncbi:MAG: hypothetical protein KKF26_05845 [Chloroflexi bacterium]|nr:hypothetical protein [Chloroflexota bacterium]